MRRPAHRLVCVAMAVQVYACGAAVAGSPPPIDREPARAHEHGQPRGKVRVAIIDSGLNPDDEIRRGVLVSSKGYNYGDCHPSAVPECTRGADTNPTDRLGHGTKVAKVFVGHLRRLLVETATTLSVEVLPIKINPGTMDDFAPGAVAAAIEHAVRLEARVINLSIEMPVLNDDERRTLAEVIDRAVAAGVVLVAAAGNRNGERPFPASHANVIAVEGLGIDGSPLAVRPAAQGVSISASALSTPNPGSVKEERNGTLGTSFAAPRVAAAAAMILAVNPCLSPSEVRDVLIKSASPVHAGERLSATLGSGGDAVAHAVSLRRSCDQAAQAGHDDLSRR